MMTYIMSSSDTPKEELRKTYKDRFTRSADILARSHVRLGLEFLGPLHIRKQFKYEFIWKMPEMLEFAKECGSNVGLTLDAWHWHHAGATTADILAAGKDRIVTVHFDDSPDLPPDKIRDNERLMPGEGVIDLNGFLQALQKIGYRGCAQRGSVRARAEGHDAGRRRAAGPGKRAGRAGQSRGERKLDRLARCTSRPRPNR